MTPEEKAKELVNKYWNLPTTFNYVIDGVVFVDNSHINYKTAKQCALVTVDEIMKIPILGRSHNRDESQYDYWQGVKEEIINL